MVNFDFCNNDLYAGLSYLKSIANHSCMIILQNGNIYTNFIIHEESCQIILSNCNGNTYAMDINLFVEQCIEKNILFYVS